MLTRLTLDRVKPNPDQPRKTFDPKSLEELADSIAENGLLQPITVRPMPDKSYQIVAGERRFRAHQLLNQRNGKRFNSILCQVRKMDDLARDIAAIIENLQRDEVSPLEEAEAFGRLADAGLSPEEIAEKIGAAVFRVRWRLQLLNLDPSIRKIFASGQIDKQQALELARLDRHEDQLRVFRMINRGQLSGWKAVRNAVDAIKENLSQSDIFGVDDRNPRQSLKAVVSMERKIDTIACAISSGWRDGECKIAALVDPNRARAMADKLAALSQTIRVMERELRNVAAQADVLA
jgi:ParB family chromosome partitioning protein